MNTISIIRRALMVIHTGFICGFSVMILQTPNSTKTLLWLIAIVINAMGLAIQILNEIDD